MWISYVTIVRAAERVVNEIFASSLQESEYLLDVCCATTVIILRCTDHVRNFVWSSVWKYIDFSSALTVEDICFILLPFMARNPATNIHEKWSKFGQCIVAHNI
jgi:hypothetical protein